MFLHAELNILANVQTSRPVVVATSTVTATTYFDAVPMPSATSLPPLPTGSFNIHLLEPSFSANDCLVGSSQEAWACTNEGDLDLDVYIDSENVTAISIKSSYPPVWRYGPQPPEVRNVLAVLPVQDSENTEKGPAYYFQQSFDKLVILNGDDFSDNLEKRSPMDRELHADLGRRGSTGFAAILPHSRTWFCHWNGTLLEAFIFIQDPAQESTPTPNPMATPSTMKYLRRDPAPFPSPTNTFPKTIKVEERRNPVNGVGPYCEPMIILDSVTATPDPTRSTIQLNESEPAFYSPDMRRRDLLEGLMVEKRSVVYGCQCKWLSP